MQMKAIVYKQPGPITAPNALIELTTETPKLGARDLLVAVKGVSVNPVDVKVRAGFPVTAAFRILGYDAAGVVKAIGSDVRTFKVGDEVFYAGDFTRPGSNAELQAVDERIVGKKPQCLDFAEAAGLPLTSITAWELLFDSLALKEGDGNGEAILIIGGAGGVGSILIQLVKKLTQLTVITTASRAESKTWVQKMGADHVIDHKQSLVEQLQTLQLQPRYVAALTGTAGHLAAIIELIKPRGHVAVIDNPETLDIMAGKAKSLSFSWEFMFARSMHQMDDMQTQQHLLNRISTLLDSGALRSTVTRNLGTISVATLTAAHAHQESGRAIGKQVLAGFEA